MKNAIDLFCAIRGITNLRLETFCLIIVLIAAPLTYGWAEDLRWCITGYDALKERDYDIAIEHFSQCLATGNLSRDNQNETYHNRAQARAGKEEYDLAIQDYTRAINLNSQDVVGYFNRGLMYHRIALKYTKRGLADRAKPAFDQAIQDYTRAINLDSQDASSYYSRGIAYASTTQYDRAIQDLDKAIDLQDHRKSHYERCRILGWWGRPEQAKTSCEELVQFRSTDPKTWDLMAFVHWQLGENSEARAALVRAKQLDPDFWTPDERLNEYPIVLAQGLLRSLGYDPGGRYGIMWSATRRALQAFQRRHNLKPDGQLTQETMQMLKKATR